MGQTVRSPSLGMDSLGRCLRDLLYFCVGDDQVNFVSGNEAGKTFEKLFERTCQLSGLWAEANHTKAKRAWKGRLQELESNLDYMVATRDGRVGFFDCKSYDRPYFDFSKLKPHQVELARRYNEWKIPSGFVVWFRPINQVCFFPGWLIAGRGPGTRFTPLDGTALGSWGRFDPTKLLSAALGSASVSG
jgi:hypothetical protein